MPEELAVLGTKSAGGGGTTREATSGRNEAEAELLAWAWGSLLKVAAGAREAMPKRVAGDGREGLTLRLLEWLLVLRCLARLKATAAALAPGLRPLLTLLRF